MMGTHIVNCCKCYVDIYKYTKIYLKSVFDKTASGMKQAYNGQVTKERFNEFMSRFCRQLMQPARIRLGYNELI